MRIHYLAVQAIGPFAERYSIDFDQLSASGLFLLEGPTGAGKSTIIDAIVYGLYGRLASDRASDQRLHSNHAAPTITPQVELVFSTAQGTYRVHRVPRHERPKHRGEGTTTQNARAWLWQLPHWDPRAHPAEESPGAFGQPLAATPQEVGTELGRLLPLSAEQFTQTVVLPQGQFATFLQARPEDRRKVLQDVFGTQIFVAVQEELAQRARDARREVDKVKAAVGEAVRGFLTAADISSGGGRHSDLSQAAEDLDEAALKQLTAEVLAELEATHHEAQQHRTSAEGAENAAVAQWEAARRLDQLLEQRRTLIAQRHDLEQRQTSMAQAEQRLSAAEQAERLQRPIVRAEQAAAEAAAAVAELRRRRHELEEEPYGAEVLALRDPESLAGRARELHHTLGGLAELLGVEAGLPQRRAELAKQHHAITQHDAALSQLRDELQARPTQRAELVTQHTAAQVEAGALAAAEARLATAQTVHAAAIEAQTIAAELAEATAEVETLVLATQRADERLSRLRQTWLAGLAGTLAAQLTAGEACQVCGSTDHPAPAEAPVQAVTQEDVDSADAEARELTSRLTEATVGREGLAQRHRLLQEQAAGRAPEQSAEELHTAETAVTAAREAVDRVAKLAQQLEDFDTATSDLSARLAIAERDLADMRSQAAAVEQRITEDETTIAANLAGATTLAERVELLRRQAAACEDLAAALESVAQLKTASTQAHDELSVELAAAGFTSVAEAQAASLPAAELSALRSDVTEYHREKHRVTQGLEQPAIAALTGTEDPQLAAREQAVAAAREAVLAATEAATRAAERFARTQRAHEVIDTAWQAYERSSATARAVLRMASIAAGGEGNQHDTTLATYVLLRRFEDVVAAANQRLDVMSDGRYRLARIDEREGGRRARQAGLGLAVHDNLTDRARDPHTLSGGETFYVSLCLALGLADIVTSEAGGVSLDTLFIDEGFGSLDPNTLDAVLSELSGLQAGGRSVGIVSHVSELKSRIAERIEVRPLPSGASRVVVRA